MIHIKLKRLLKEAIMRSKLRVIALLSGLLMLSPMTLAGSNMLFGLGVENFVWKEFDTDGSQLLEETGPRYVFSFLYQNQFSADWDYQVTADLYAGNVDYDGQTQMGDPITTTSEYTGVRGDFIATYNIGGSDSPFALLAGAGLDAWSRNLRDTTLPDSTPVYGYQENYLMIYARLGLQLQFSHSSWSSKLKAGLRRPLIVEETIDEFDVTLEPKPTTTYFAAWQNIWKLEGDHAFGLNIYYEHTRFDASDPEFSNIGYVYQPESDMKTVGVTGYYSF
jgi:hypothetical protein